MNPLAPRPLNDTDRLEGFDCGNTDLNNWLASRARANQRRGDSRTYISIDADSGEIAGYYSLSAWSISRGTIGGWLARNAPDPVSVILLGRLATSINARGFGLGRALLHDAIANASAGAQLLGARALVTEAIDASAAAFYTRQGMRQVQGRDNVFFAPLR